MPGRLFSLGNFFPGFTLQVRRNLREGSHPGRVSRPSTLWYHRACSKPWDGGGPGLFPVSRKRTKMDGNDKGELLYRRRSSRMVLRVPLLINAVDSSGEGSWEQVETVVVSMHGGLVRTHQTYPVGVTLDVRRRDDERSARARVVWMSSKINSQGLDLGFEILDHPEFWGVNFPPDRRSKEASPKALRR